MRPRFHLLKRTRRELPPARVCDHETRQGEAPGRPLDAAVRIPLESAFRRDLGAIRVHGNSQAAAEARSLGAVAFTVGSDIALGDSAANATGRAKLRILAHEVAHALQQTRPLHQAQAPAPSSLPLSAPSDLHEREAESMAEGALSGKVQLAPTPAPPQVARSLQSSWTSLERGDFEKTMKTRFNVFEIHTGDYGEQAAMVNTRRGGGSANPGLTPAMWQTWDPGSSSPVYRFIVDAFTEFASSLGGVPEVKHLIFFDTEYELGPTGAAVARTDVGADYGAGTLTVYRAAERSRKPLPLGRSTPSGNYPDAPVAGLRMQGSSPGAPIPIPAQKQSVKRTIAHELGHGLAEAALFRSSAVAAADPSMLEDYARETGWYVRGAVHELYDAGRVEVRTALANGTQPPERYRITADNWNDPGWLEQPVSLYMVAAGEASEDFAEAAMAYVSDPALLKARSPRRFAFIESRKSRWQPRLAQAQPAANP